MACGATLKRSMEFEALHSPQSPKRRRCNPLPGTPVTLSPKRCNLLSDTGDSSMSPQSTCGGEHRLTPEQIVHNLRQEYSRYQRRWQLEGGFNQSESQTPSDGPGQSPGFMAPSSPPGVSMKRDLPCFTLRQVGSLCERILKDHEETIREECLMNS
ncbi:unnamed protein product [Coregonus sp. 'balchen']|nr:unnamed protein product [Coregonus sp. 'balchen']